MWRKKSVAKSTGLAKISQRSRSALWRFGWPSTYINPTSRPPTQPSSPAPDSALGVADGPRYIMLHNLHVTGLLVIIATSGSWAFTGLARSPLSFAAAHRIGRSIPTKLRPYPQFQFCHSCLAAYSGGNFLIVLNQLLSIALRSNTNTLPIERSNSAL